MGEFKLPRRDVLLQHLKPSNFLEVT